MQINQESTFFKHNLQQIKPFVVSVVVVLMVTAATCSCDGNQKRTEVVDAPSALKAHRDFLKKVSRTKKTDIEELIALTKEWFVLSDSLEHHIQPDSVKQKVYDKWVFSHLQDSVADCLERMVDAEIRSFEDVLIVREALSEQPNDSLIFNVCADARKFFESLDLAQVPDLSSEEALDSYTALLKNHLKKGIKSKSDLQRFIRAEDIAFRGFLVHLHELGNTSLKNITKTTESICELIFRSAKDGQMETEVPLVYMVMRTNRRIIQNAMTCLDDIKSGRVTGNDEQAIVYQWMMMKPFFPTDELSLALLSDKQKENLRTLADELPDVSAMLSKRKGWSMLPIDEMPNEIIKEYVSAR